MLTIFSCFRSCGMPLTHWIMPQGEESEQDSPRNDSAFLHANLAPVLHMPCTPLAAAAPQISFKIIFTTPMLSYLNYLINIVISSRLFCRYGMLDKNQWPNWSVGALANSQPAYGNHNHGCGCLTPSYSDSEFRPLSRVVIREYALDCVPFVARIQHFHVLFGLW